MLCGMYRAFALIYSLACLAAASMAAEADVQKLAWMAGCWTTDTDKPTVIEEHWSKPAGGGMLGYGRTLKFTPGEPGRSARVIFFEFMRLDTQGNELVYTPRFGTTQKPVPFRLTTLSGQSVVFENPEH